MFKKYIDVNTFDIRNDVFNVDELIADAISVLNKKGYKTSACCSGHDKEWLKTEEILKNDNGLKLMRKNGKPIIFDKIEDVKNIYCAKMQDVDIVEKEDMYVIFYNETTGNSTYVLFDKDYKFEKIPQGFTKDSAWDEEDNCWSSVNFDGILKHIVYYDENENRRSRDEIKKEIEENNKILYQWACDLPDNNNN